MAAPQLFSLIAVAQVVLQFTAAAAGGAVRLRQLQQEDTTAKCTTAGQRCTKGDMEENQGMCIFKNEESNIDLEPRPKCMDMCDNNTDSQEFGRSDWTNPSFVDQSLVDIVEAVRSGNDDVQCPGGWNIWQILTLAVLIIGCCICVLLLWRIKEKESEPSYEQLHEESPPEPAQPPPPQPEPVPEEPAEPEPEGLVITFITNDNGKEETVKFLTRPLGFKFAHTKGAPVNHITNGGQAQSLGVQLGWTFKLVNGVPAHGTKFPDFVKQMTDLTNALQDTNEPQA